MGLGFRVLGFQGLRLREKVAEQGLACEIFFES
jgi:hypothetical protein